MQFTGKLCIVSIILRSLCPQSNIIYCHRNVEGITLVSVITFVLGLKKTYKLRVSVGCHPLLQP